MWYTNTDSNYIGPTLIMLWLIGTPILAKILKWLFKIFGIEVKKYTIKAGDRTVDIKKYESIAGIIMFILCAIIQIYIIIDYFI